MKKSDLEKLKALKQEAHQLQDELHNLPITTDSVSGSMSEFPYIKQTYKIRGIDEQKARRIRLKLDSKLEEIQDSILAMEEWLEEIPDPEMRVILRMRYRNNLTQGEIGTELGFDRSVVSRKLKIFWESQTCTQNTQ